MGGFTPITTVLGTAFNTLGRANDAYQRAANYQQARAAYDQREREIAQNRDTELKKLSLEKENDEKRRRDALKRAVAKQQAIFGGQGIDSTDGSGEAVMLGLFKESNDERDYRERLDALKRSSLEQDAINRRRRNLLDLQNKYASATNSLFQDF